MNNFFYTSFFIFFVLSNASLFANCPGCVIDLPDGLAEDTLFLGELANGTANAYYDQDLSFRMPMTTTPVNALDPEIPAGLNISGISVVSISNLPPGLSWESNQTNYNPSDNPDGCMKFCGTPLVPGLYVMEVTVEATVVIITQETSFPISILIEEGSSNNDGFSLTNNVGCGEVTVDFSNNVPSNGNTGYSYHWNFGNGVTSLDESPSDQTYNTPGTFIVNYQAVIDTTGFILSSVKVNDVGCFDTPTFSNPSNNPDMHLEIYDPNNNLIYESATINNTDPPVEYFPNINLATGNYSLKVIDSDSGINGADDTCVETNFTQISNGILSADDWEIELEIFHPVDTITTTDTVIVYEIPGEPMISNSGAEEFCGGETVTLTSSYEPGNQWFMDGEIIDGAVGETLEVDASGSYQVEFTSLEGCSAVSDATLITVNENPATPQFSNTNNLLTLLESITYDLDITLQWYQSGVVLDGETSLSYCALEDGTYTLEATNFNTGCVSIFTQEIIYDGTLECFTNTSELAEIYSLKIYPNPATVSLSVNLNTTESKNLEIRIFDLLGRQQNETIKQSIFGATQLNPIAIQHLASGLYILEVRLDEELMIQRFVKD